MGQAKKKQMECPAVGRRIKLDECGENRISNYACPADCPHNPWSTANYGRALEIQDRFTEKMVSRLRAEQVLEHGYALSPPFDAKIPEFSTFQWFSDKFYRETDSSRRTFKDRWEAECYDGLNNDQRILLAAEANMRPVVLEILQVIDAQSMLAADLLDPGAEPFRVLDRSFAEQACRFSTLFGMVFDLPHYSRIHSAGCPLPDVDGLGAREVFMEVTAHLGAPAHLPELHAWLPSNLFRVVESLRAVSAARREAMFRNVDMAYTKSVYELECTPEIFRKALGKQKDIEPEELGEEDADKGFVAEWVFLGGKSPYAGGEPIIGRILQHADGFIQLEASSAARTESLKQRVEKVLGKHARFSRERTDDLAMQTFSRHRADYDNSLVPARLMENTTRLETSVSRIEIKPGVSTKAEIERQLEAEFLRTFLDNPVPLLDGRTPRQAAEDPAVRPKLVELMKSHVRKHDENSLRTGSDTDINWMLEELGLNEISFPPPPPRKSLVGADDDEEWDDDEETYLLDETHIRERNKELDGFGAAHLIECFKVGFPDMQAQIERLCTEEGLGDVEERLLELFARIAFMGFDPALRLFEEVHGELIDGYIGMLVGDARDNGFEGMLEGLDQPVVARMAAKQLGMILPRGLDNPAFSICFMLLLALSEAMSDILHDVSDITLDKDMRKDRH